MALTDVQIKERRSDLAALDDESGVLRNRLVELGTEIAAAQTAASDAEADASAEITAANAEFEAAKAKHAATVSAARSKVQQARTAVAKLATDQELASKRRQVVKRLYSDGLEDEQRVFAAEEELKRAEQVAKELADEAAAEK